MESRVFILINWPILTLTLCVPLPQANLVPRVSEPVSLDSSRTLPSVTTDSSLLWLPAFLNSVSERFQLSLLTQGSLPFSLQSNTLPISHPSENVI